ncbi:MAG TPA: hypothetical protein VE685_11200 [Thermoanaerobaculia bacterium]|nr:hypothetical protein [Thermoanaerobaculia bacterium]
MVERKAALPSLRDLYLRHPGLYEPLCRAYADAAAICLAENYVPPVEIEILYNNSSGFRDLSWEIPAENAKASWNNKDDATEQGAYSVSLAVVEAELGLVALSRAETRTGADYYIGIPGTDLEESYRLEVSGTRSSEMREVQSRLRQKLEQARKGQSNKPALACIVGFGTKTIAIADLEYDA